MCVTQCFYSLCDGLCVFVCARERDRESVCERVFLRVRVSVLVESAAPMCVARCLCTLCECDEIVFVSVCVCV